MIKFIVKGNKARTAPDFLLKDLPGSGGRMDIMCRCLTSALLVSHGIRRDVEVILCLSGPPSPPRCIRVVGDNVKYLSPDERSTSILIRKALAAYKEGEEVESTPGIFVSERSFRSILEENRENLVLLDEEGDEYDIIPFENPCFVIGDHLGFDDGEKEMLKNAKIKMKVSPTILHASHCIVILHSIMDRSAIYGS